MTGRGRAVLALAVACYLAAWTLGSRPLYPVAVGLGLAVALSIVWVRLSAQPMRLRRETGRHAQFEGEVVPVRLTIEPSTRVLPPSLVVEERIGRLGPRATTLDRLRGAYLLDAVPRGRYPFERSRALIGDPFGLAAAEIQLQAPGSLLVRPRVVAVRRLFSDAGVHRAGGARQLVRRPAGLDVHGVREWVEGESLRHVHWGSTAKTGRLMVKEVEDTPRDEVAILLDARSGVSAAVFDVQVRAAASLLRAYASRHRETRLLVNARRLESHTVRSLGSDWEAALDVLAGVEADGRTPLEALLAEDGAGVRSLELVVVTASLRRTLVERLVRLTAARRPVSAVFVAESHALEPELVRLQTAGAAVTVVRPGADLRAALEGGGAAG